MIYLTIINALPVKQRMKKAFLENHFFHRIQPTHAVQNFEGCQLWVQLSQTFLLEFSHLNGFKGSCGQNQLEKLEAAKAA